jgi:fatty acid desaturase
LEGGKMANEPDTHKSSTMKTVDTVLVIAGVIAAIMVGLWVFSAIVGAVLWVFKIAILVIVVVVLVRFFTRKR